MTDIAVLNPRRRGLLTLTAEQQAALKHHEAIIARHLGAPGTQPRRAGGITKTDRRAHDVYVHLAADDTVLYVGVSLSTAQRTGYHRANSGWWRQVATIRIEHLPNREAALTRESDLIAKLRPLHNRAGVR